MGVVRGPLGSGGRYYEFVDSGWGERVGAQGLGDMMGKMGWAVNVVQRVVFGVVIFILVL